MYSKTKLLTIPEVWVGMKINMNDPVNINSSVDITYLDGTKRIHSIQNGIFQSSVLEKCKEVWHPDSIRPVPPPKHFSIHKDDIGVYQKKW